MVVIGYLLLISLFAFISFDIFNLYLWTFDKIGFTRQYGITDMYVDGCHYGSDYVICDIERYHDNRTRG